MLWGWNTVLLMAIFLFWCGGRTARRAARDGNQPGTREQPAVYHLLGPGELFLFYGAVRAQSFFRAPRGCYTRRVQALLATSSRRVFERAWV